MTALYGLCQQNLCRVEQSTLQSLVLLRSTIPALFTKMFPVFNIQFHFCSVIPRWQHWLQFTPSCHIPAAVCMQRDGRICQAVLGHLHCIRNWRSWSQSVPFPFLCMHCLSDTSLSELCTRKGWEIAEKTVPLGWGCSQCSPGAFLPATGRGAYFSFFPPLPSSSFPFLFFPGTTLSCAPQT